MERRMIVFDHGNVRYNVRVAAIILDAGRVLVQQFEGTDFWCLPGGRAELLEPLDESLRREMQEELGEDVAIARLVWVMENFYQYQGTSYHELGMYFLAQLPAESALPGRTESWDGYEETGTRMTFEWHKIDALDGIPLLPGFLCSALRDLPAETRHVVWRDE